MDTLIIELTNQKAYKLLKELHLIRVIKKNIKTSELRNQIKSKMDAEAIDTQLNDLRGEWQSDI